MILCLCALGPASTIGGSILNFKGSDLERLFPLGRFVRQTFPRPEYRLGYFEATAIGFNDLHFGDQAPEPRDALVDVTAEA
ncbi:hypothetical protein GHK48_20860 [Sinorhizobium fredii]|uniref:Uncharacterized protein n=1 Tax=Rhizobium fredii TaxID=380 RepID=A0A844AEV8_RHIFR|nr:hypothetical protein [Sinorhizobium fredii]